MGAALDADIGGDTNPRFGGRVDDFAGLGEDNEEDEVFNSICCNQCWIEFRLMAKNEDGDASESS